MHLAALGAAQGVLDGRRYRLSGRGCGAASFRRPHLSAEALPLEPGQRVINGSSTPESAPDNISGPMVMLPEPFARESIIVGLIRACMAPSWSASIVLIRVRNSWAIWASA